MAFIGTKVPADLVEKAQQVFVQQLKKFVKVDHCALLIDIFHPSPIPSNLTDKWPGFLLITAGASAAHVEDMAFNNSDKDCTLVHDLDDMITGIHGKKIVKSDMV